MRVNMVPRKLKTALTDLIIKPIVLEWLKNGACDFDLNIVISLIRHCILLFTNNWSSATHSKIPEDIAKANFSAQSRSCKFFKSELVDMKPVSIKIEGTLGSFKTEKLAFRNGVGFNLIPKFSKFFKIASEKVFCFFRSNFKKLIKFWY